MDVYTDTIVPLNVQYTMNPVDDWIDYIEAVTVDASVIYTLRFEVEDVAGNVEMVRSITTRGNGDIGLGYYLKLLTVIIYMCILSQIQYTLNAIIGSIRLNLVKLTSIIRFHDDSIN